MNRTIVATSLIAVFLASPLALGQTSSLGGRKREEDASKPPEVVAREAEKPVGNPVVEEYSWIATKPEPPQTFKVNDLVTIIVREQRRFEADSELKTDKSYDITSEIEAFAKLTNGGLGAANFSRGKPDIDYKFENKLDGSADTKREDSLTARVTARIIDVKPNGLLVLEARQQITHEEEISTFTLTGMCRKEDVTADNTVLSTQIAEKEIKVDNAGALRDSARRGWIPRLVDALRPF